MPIKKQLTVSKAKAKAWDAFSKYIRLRDAIKTTGTKTHLVCITCDRTYKAFGAGCAHAGHFLPGRGNSVLIDEDFVHGQCAICNRWMKGVWPVYEKKMIEMWGKKKVEKVKEKYGQTLQRKVYEWVEIEEQFEAKYQNLLDKEV